MGHRYGKPKDSIGQGVHCPYCNKELRTASGYIKHRSVCKKREALYAQDGY